MAHPNMESDKMLDVYIHDYLVKRKYNASAKTFQAESEVPTNLNVIDAPGGFLFEWWSVFWDTFIARYKCQVSGPVESYNEAEISKDEEKQQNQWHRKSRQKMQRQNQQHQREETQHQNGSPTDSLARKNSHIASATKMNEEGLKLPVQNDPLDDTYMNPRYGDNVGHLMNPNYASIMKSVATVGRSLGDTSHGGNLTNHHSNKSQQQFPLSAQDINSRHMVNFGAASSDGLLVRVNGSNQGINNLPLKGWPLMGLDHLQPGLLQPQKPLMQPPQSCHQLQLQQQVMLQRKQNLVSTSASNVECGKLKMLLSNQNMGIGKDGQSNSVGDIVFNDGSMVQVGCPVLSRADINILLKQQMQNSNQHQHTLISQQLQNSNCHLQEQDNLVGAVSVTSDASLSNTSQGNDQASKNHSGQKRKKPMSSSNPANSSLTANTTGPSPSSAPSTPSIHATGDIISMPILPHNDGSSKPLCMFGNDSVGTLTSAPNQLADMDCLVDNGSLDDNGESVSSQDDADPGMDAGEGLAFSEIGSIHASAIDCCHFSSDGKLLVTGGHDKKAKLWCTDSREQKSTLEEHSNAITDSRFSPTMPWLATSSLDKTIRVWDVENPGYSLRTFIGHSASVMSLDFHPNKGDLICSCDDISEIRYWSIKNGGCAGVSKGGATQVRFQPSLGRYLAAVVRSGVSIIDVETAQTCGNPLKGDASNVQSVCWDFCGGHLASVNEDSIKVWKIGSGGAQRDCIHEFSVRGKKFRCCVFRPHYPSLLVIGCYQSLELWNMAENKVMSPLGQPVAALAVSEIAGLVASACHDNLIKIWK